MKKKKRKLTLVVKDTNGKLINTMNLKKENHPAEIKVENSIYDRYTKHHFSINWQRCTNIHFIHYIRLDTFTNPKKDVVFKYLNLKSYSAITAIHSVGADGNCGFRAVSYDVYKDQTKWRNVKSDMLKTYIKFKNTLYTNVSFTEPIEIELSELRMLNRLQSTISPCHDEHLWFSTFICPQIVADTYERPVIVYCYQIFTIESTGKQNPIYESQIYYPLINMKSNDVHRPITLLLAFKHFYYVEVAHTPTGRLKKFDRPVLNMDHNRLREKYKSICNKENFALLF